MTPGLHSFPAEQYHSGAGVSRSMLEWISPPKTPAHYRAKWIDKLIPDETTPAMEFGTLLHRATLEPDTIEGAFHVKPEKHDGRTKEGRAWAEAHADLPVISAQQAAALNGIAKSLLAHPKARMFLEKSDKEKNAYADDSGILLRARYDLLPTWEGANMIADIKTCEAADEGSAAKSILNYGYHRQAAFYCRVARLLGLGRTSFVFIFVEKSPPYCVNVFRLDQLVLEYADKLIAHDLQVLRNCQETGEWPAYPDDTIPAICLPGYAMKAIENAL